MANERECKCGPYYDCEEHDTDPGRSRDKWRARALAAESHAADRAALVERLELRTLERDEARAAVSRLIKKDHESADQYQVYMADAESEVTCLTQERDEARAELASGAAVLAAVAAAVLCDDDPDADPLEPQEHGEDCYLYTDDQFAIAKAELARRAGREPVPLDELNAAESECAALRAESDGRHTANLALCEEVNRLRAEGQRFRLLRDHWKEQRDLERADLEDSVAQKQAAECSLAAANALLGRLRRENVRWSGTGTTQLARDVDAHLAAQPAMSPAPDETVREATRILGEVYGHSRTARREPSRG